MPQFDVFLSHSSVDKSWVIKLKDDLLRYGVSVWLDKDEIRPGDLFGKALEQALDNSRAVALVVSPEAINSGWVEEEYYRALTLAKNKQTPAQIIPVILREAELPGFLQSRNWVDFRDETTYAQNVWTLVWGITGNKPAQVLDLTSPDVAPTASVSSAKQTEPVAANTTTSSNVPRESQITGICQWKVNVFDFFNYGETAKRDHIGERFSELILNALIRLHLKANQMNEEPSYLPVRSVGLSSFDWREYLHLMPFIAVVGSVEDPWDDKIFASIRVARVTSDDGAISLAEGELNFGYNPKEMREVAQSTAEEIRQVILTTAAYEESVQTIRAYNQPILHGFQTWLEESGLTRKTVQSHIHNIHDFAEYLFCRDDSLKRLDEADSDDVGTFLLNWLPREVPWLSVSSLKSYLASIRKFFKWMGETDRVSPRTVTSVLTTLTEDRDKYLEGVGD